MSEPSFRKNESAHRYEVLVDGEVAGFIEYGVLANGIVFSHTEVQPRHEGRGYSSRLLKFALDDVRALGTHVVPVCPFVSGYLRKHPELQDLVTPEGRKAFRI